MKKISVGLPTSCKDSYPVYLEVQLLKNPQLWLPASKKKFVIITDKNVAALYGYALQKRLKKFGVDSSLIEFPPGERSKNVRIKTQIEQKMFFLGCSRETCILALGGGVVGDLSGFIAATYMRGIRYLQIPTTLLAMVDSSVGGKTGINTPYGKNLLGAFWQPDAVVVDIACLNTLTPKQLINGFIESFKIFLVSEKRQLLSLEKKRDAILNRDSQALLWLVEQSVKMKSHIVSVDVKENGVRAILNFGHTIGHALEKLSHYRCLHGYAVAHGILVESVLSWKLGLLRIEALEWIQKFLACLGISGKNLRKYSPLQVIAETYRDKKNDENSVRYVLLEALGSAHVHAQKYTHSVSDKLVEDAFNYVVRNY